MKKISFLLILFCLVACRYPLSDYYNGYASIREFARKDKEKRKTFYNKQTLEQKALDIRNRKVCREHLTRDNKGKYYAETNKQMEIYSNCMRGRGTVFYSD